MEKKKTKLTISGNPKKSIDNIELARLKNKNSVVIEKKTSRFTNNNSTRKSSGFRPRLKQNIDFVKVTGTLNKKPQISSDHEKRKLAEQRATKRLKGGLTHKDSKGKVGTKKRELKLTLSRALSNEIETKSRSLASLKRAKQKENRDQNKDELKENFKPVKRDVDIPEAITVRELANRMAEQSSNVIKHLLGMGVTVTINQALAADTAEYLVKEFGHNPIREAKAEEIVKKIKKTKSGNLLNRPPIVTVMGHVDHGKTSLLDTLRNTNVISGEFGGITQHIGAYQIENNSNKITFIDTPGHAAFTEMRARGSKLTDIVVLVVAADDGVKPQTIESIKHAKAAKVPIVVAISKCDLPDADPQKIKNQLLEYELIAEELSGDVLMIEISTKTKQNIEKLIESIILQAEILDLKTDYETKANGVVLESKIDIGRGPIVSVIVTSGTIRKGDYFVSGLKWGKVRALINDFGKNIEKALPASPVEILGINGAAKAGDDFLVLENENEAKLLCEVRIQETKKDKNPLIFATQESAFKDKISEELNIIIKSDVHGSSEAIKNAINQIKHDEVKPIIILADIGMVTETDISLAKASSAIIIAFNVKPSKEAKKKAEQEKITISLYNIIYEAIDFVKKKMSGLLTPNIEEKIIGTAEILEIFKVSKVGKVARQADGAIIATCGETVVIATAVGAKKVNPDVDYFPLQVNYQEKYYAAGKIPGGYFKREARPTEAETLISRLIDRPIRPLFPEEFRNEVQVLPTVLSYDGVNEPDVLSIIASSAALAISGMPFQGPVGASRVGYIDEKYVLNPSKEEIEKSKLDLVVAGTKDAVLMVESEASGLTEEVMLNAVKFGHEKFVPVIKAIEKLVKDCGKEQWVVEKKDLSELQKKISDNFKKDLKTAFSIKDKQKRSNLIGEISEKCKVLFENDETYTNLDVSMELKKLEKTIVRTDILKNKSRIDGRSLTDVRQISCEVGVLPRTHGSALFTRGETQALVTLTLGTSEDEQRVESLEGLKRNRFMLHYNFPPFSVGETGRIGTGRREIGHGKLAWRALNSSLPAQEKFPYTYRIVSEITESNGSSSMATVCGASLALMDAGVPMKAAVAGIAMGLIKEGDNFSVLSDILGDEDHLGDMDFKVAGTKDGITSLQMDIKITGITFEIMDQALSQAKDGRIHILGEMTKALTGSRDAVSKYTPKIETVMVDKKDIAAVIGKGGATIREIVELSGAKVDVKDTGEVTVAAPDEESRLKAMKMIKDIVAKPEMNKIYKGKVIKIMEFGAFVNFLGKQDGLVHISELADKRVAKVTDVVKEGDEVKVKVIGFDRGKVKLSIKQAAI